MNNRYYAVCGIVEIDGRVLLVRHTYGNAKGRILLPGGYVQENELPTAAVEREIREETGVAVRAGEVFAVQFKPAEWCVVFTADYVSGTPESDAHENSEVLLLKAGEAVLREDITNLSREILTAYMNGGSALPKSGYVPKALTAEEYVIFGV